MLALVVREKQDIGGIWTWHLEHKILLYADDAVFIVGEPQYSLRELKRLLHQYGRVSDYKVNETICTILGINVGTEMKKSVMEFDTTPCKSIPKT